MKSKHFILLIIVVGLLSFNNYAKGCVVTALLVSDDDSKRIWWAVLPLNNFPKVDYVYMPMRGFEQARGVLTMLFPENVSIIASEPHDFDKGPLVTPSEENCSRPDILIDQILRELSAVSDCRNLGITLKLPFELSYQKQNRRIIYVNNRFCLDPKNKGQVICVSVQDKERAFKRLLMLTRLAHDNSKELPLGMVSDDTRKGIVKKSMTDDQMASLWKGMFLTVGVLSVNVYRNSGLIAIRLPANKLKDLIEECETYLSDSYL